MKELSEQLVAAGRERDSYKEENRELSTKLEKLSAMVVSLYPVCLHTVQQHACTGIRANLLCRPSLLPRWLSKTLGERWSS